LVPVVRVPAGSTVQQHAGDIAKVFDAGTTSKGQPYFVMELVAGRTLLAACVDGTVQAFNL